jgi:hypothetical protein
MATGSLLTLELDALLLTTLELAALDDGDEPESELELPQALSSSAAAMKPMHLNEKQAR